MRKELAGEKRIALGPVVGLIAACSVALSMLVGTAVAEGRTPSKPGAKVYFISPEDGATLTSPVTIRFGLKGMGVAPAGVEKEGTGHFHLIIDSTPPAVDKPIPADDNHRHFGGGQIETEIELSPGPHLLQILLSDHLHIPHDPPLMSETIAITVEAPAGAKTSEEK